MKENKVKSIRLPSNRFLAALIVVTLTIASLWMTTTLLGCDKPNNNSLLFCTGCAQQVSQKQEHAITCGEATHFYCDGFTHGLADCGEHFACIDAIAKYEAEIDPTQQETKLLAEIKADYSKAKADLHKAADCEVEGHFKCDDKEHSTELCTADSEDTGHTHNYSIATCIAPAACTVEGCSEIGSEVDASNHTGGTEVKDQKDATCSVKGYTGDIYCKGCNTMIQKGAETALSATHSGGTELKNIKEPTCCEAGNSGDTYCKGCGAKIEDGDTVDATGQHPTTECNTHGHHAHDGNDHSGAVCQILGHYACDNKGDPEKGHLDWMCIDQNDVNKIVRVEVTINNPGTTWSFTIGGHTINNENIANYEHEVVLGDNSIKVNLSTMQGYTFSIDTTDGKKVYIADHSTDAGYNDMTVNGEDHVTITVSMDMLKAETYGQNIRYALFITIKDPA